MNQRRRTGRPARRSAREGVERALAGATLADLVDNTLNKGVVLSGEIVLGLAGVDLIYLRVAAILAAADRIAGRPR